MDTAVLNLLNSNNLESLGYSRLLKGRGTTKVENHCLKDYRISRLVKHSLCLANISDKASLPATIGAKKTDDIDFLKHLITRLVTTQSSLKKQLQFYE